MSGLLHQVQQPLARPMSGAAGEEAERHLDALADRSERQHDLALDDEDRRAAGLVAGLPVDQHEARAPVFHRLCHANNAPAPTIAALSEMLDQLTRTLAELRHKPTRILKTECWGWSGQILVRLRIECEAGEPARPFASWFQWQHPRWEWSLAMLPTVDLARTERGQIEPLALVAREDGRKRPDARED